LFEVRWPEKGPRDLERSDFSVKRRNWLSIRITSLFWLPLPTCQPFPLTSLHDFRTGSRDRRVRGPSGPETSPEPAPERCVAELSCCPVRGDGLAREGAGCSRVRGGWRGRGRADPRTRRRWTRARG